MIINTGATNPVEISFSDDASSPVVHLELSAGDRTTQARRRTHLHVRGNPATTVRIYAW